MFWLELWFKRFLYRVLAMGLCLSVSVTSRSSTKTAKRRITQTTPHDSPGTLVFWRQRSPRNSTGGHPLHGGRRMQFWRYVNMCECMYVCMHVPYPIHVLGPPVSTPQQASRSVYPFSQGLCCKNNTQSLERRTMLDLQQQAACS